ncbi:hypothetical protein GPECTOR_5g386 [Gonium pectorale]|uniref:Uncharacterized protein n=1 Tax=Gonium pectorale TaxID=33097 RepID=A0A150GY80_GONPE|nr:hypothetical protein GPECTOR_5g386 [Gonium pectorale]|eukprot:KXZ54300.1 hypothetical protein GPECTOR_5g386 [Gonium pectorale]
MLTPQTHHDNADGNAHAEPSGQDAEGSFILPEVNGVMSEVQAFFNAQLLPRARAIESEVANMTYEANAVTDRAEAEKLEVIKELGRLSELVVNFQNSISQFLHFGAFGAQR